HPRPEHLALDFVVERHGARLAGDQELHPPDAALYGADARNDPQGVEPVFADVLFVLALSHHEDAAIAIQSFIDRARSTGTAHRHGPGRTGVNDGPAHG